MDRWFDWVKHLWYSHSLLLFYKESHSASNDAVLPAQVVGAGVLGVVGAIGFTHFLASSLLSGIPQAFLIILFICSSATSFELPGHIQPILLANAAHSHSLNAPRLTPFFFNSVILSKVRLLVIYHNASLASGSINQELLTEEFATDLATLYKLLNRSAFIGHRGIPFAPAAQPAHHPPHPQPNQEPPTGISYLPVSAFR